MFWYVQMKFMAVSGQTTYLVISTVCCLVGYTKVHQSASSISTNLYLFFEVWTARTITDRLTIGPITSSTASWSPSICMGTPPTTTTSQSLSKSTARKVPRSSSTTTSSFVGRTDFLRNCWLMLLRDSTPSAIGLVSPEARSSIWSKVFPVGSFRASSNYLSNSKKIQMLHTIILNQDELHLCWRRKLIAEKSLTHWWNLAGIHSKKMQAAWTVGKLRMHFPQTRLLLNSNREVTGKYHLNDLLREALRLEGWCLKNKNSVKGKIIVLLTLSFWKSTSSGTTVYESGWSPKTTFSFRERNTWLTFARIFRQECPSSVAHHSIG